MTAEPPEREPTPPERGAPDSFYAHLGAAARSRTGRSVLAHVAPYLFALVTAAGAYVTRSLQLEPRQLEQERRLTAIESDLAAVRVGLAKFTTDEQRKTVRVGKQAAYATAGFEAYEAEALKRRKQAWAEKYASAYERMVAREGASPDVAYTALFRQVDTP